MFDWNTVLIGLACLVLIVGLLYELFKEQKKHVEAFTSGTSDYFSGYYPKRTDVLPGQTVEDGGWVRDLRYKEQYVDVQKIGLKADLCRVVMRRDDPGSMIMACALAGTDGTPSRNYKTKSKSEGFKFSRDDYFRDVNAEGRDDYCRIVKTNAPPQDQWASKCVLAGIDSFKPQEVKDNDPPKEIIDLLWFFEGIMLWYRFRDDIIDYAGNSNVALSGDMSIDQDPTKTLTEGLQINHVPQMLLDSPPPAEQFMRLGETKELEFESDVELRNLRAFSFWVHFDIFTNNARIFDFGNGAGHDNVFFGIEGSGNDTSPTKKKTLTAQPLDDDAVCNRSAPREVAPAQYMKMTAANVELYECPGPEPIDPAVIKKDDEETERPVKRANLLFEIWDKEQRKMRMRIVDAVQEQKWHHIAVTTVDSAFRPTWHVYIDGLRVFSKEEGHLPQTNYTTKNYIGRSNWEGAAGQGEYKDERFRGSLFDFRMYRIPMSEAKIQKTIEWGMVQIGVNIRSGPDTSGRVASAKAQKAKLDGQRKQLEADKKQLENDKKSVQEQKQSVVAQQATLATQNKILAEKTQALKTQGSAKKGTPKSGKKGTPKSGSAKKGTPKSGKKGTPKSGSAKKGTPKSGSAKKGTPKSGVAKGSTPKSGAAKGSAAKGSTPKSGVTKGSTPKSGVTKGSTPKSGATKGSTPKNDAKASAKGSTPKATDKKKK